MGRLLQKRDVAGSGFWGVVLEARHCCCDLALRLEAQLDS